MSCGGKSSKGGKECWAAARAAVLSRVARKGPFAKRAPEGDEEGGSHGDKPSCIICGAQCEMNIWGPFFKCIQNFKMSVAERDAQHKALLSVGPCVIAHASHPCVHMDVWGKNTPDRGKARACKGPEGGACLA